MVVKILVPHEGRDDPALFQLLVATTVIDLCHHPIISAFFFQ